MILFIITYFIHSVLNSKPKKIYTTNSFSLHYTFLSLSLCKFISLSPPRLFHLHGQVASNKQTIKQTNKEKKPQMVQYLLMVTRLNKSGVWIIKEPRLPKSNWSWMEIASTSQRKSVTQIQQMVQYMLMFCHWHGSALNFVIGHIV